MSGVNLTPNKAEDEPTPRMINILFNPSIYAAPDEKQNENKEISNTDKIDLITTPPFGPAQKPQPRNITTANEDISEMIHLHQRLEVLECRIRQNREFYGCSTDAVADLYSSISEFEIDPEETNFFETYFNPQNHLTIPSFWEHRVYDEEKDKLSTEKSDRLQKRLSSTLEILLVDKPERTDWRERKKLLKIIEKEDAPVAPERERRRITRWVEPPAPITQRRKRRVEQPQVKISWLKGIYPTDDSEDETDPFDFILE